MKQAKLRSIGISTAVELFDAILRESETVVSFSPDTKTASSRSKKLVRQEIGREQSEETVRRKKLALGEAEVEEERDSPRSPAAGPRKPEVTTGSLSALFKLQLLRAIGVAIVKRQRLYIL